jgi:predicted nucleotidyltransferase
VVDVGAVIEQARALLLAEPSVREVELVGSRAQGRTTDLSDVDLLVETDDFPALAARLPKVVEPLEPLARQWDRLSEEAACYMLVLPGALKLDLIFDRQPTVQPPWRVDRSTLEAIDAHFWDWILWLGGKQLAGKRPLVETHLRVVMYEHLLRPLTVTRRPESIREAIDEYLRARSACEQRLAMTVDTGLQEAVCERLRTASVI